MATFLPSRDGFAFTNSWPPEPAVSLRTPLGRVGLGNAARGLCGGMVFAALDYWQAGLTPPAARPGPGDPLFKFIVRRLIDSWHILGGVLLYYRWMRLPGPDVPRQPGQRRPGIRRRPPGGLWRPGVTRRTVQSSWPQIRVSIDAGRPAALGVVTVASANPLLIGHNHQVLAFGYRTEGTLVRLQVYDPNSGPDDGVYIEFDTADPAGTSFTHNINIAWPVRGFFLTAYSAATLPGPG